MVGDPATGFLVGETQRARTAPTDDQVPGSAGQASRRRCSRVSSRSPISSRVEPLGSSTLGVQAQQGQPGDVLRRLARRQADSEPRRLRRRHGHKNGLLFSTRSSTTRASRRAATARELREPQHHHLDAQGLGDMTGSVRRRSASSTRWPRCSGSRPARATAGRSRNDAACRSRRTESLLGLRLGRCMLRVDDQQAARGE